MHHGPGPCCVCLPPPDSSPESSAYVSSCCPRWAQNEPHSASRRKLPSLGPSKAGRTAANCISLSAIIRTVLHFQLLRSRLRSPKSLLSFFSLLIPSPPLAKIPGPCLSLHSFYLPQPASGLGQPGKLEGWVGNFVLHSAQMCCLCCSRKICKPKIPPVTVGKNMNRSTAAVITDCEWTHISRNSHIS